MNLSKLFKLSKMLVSLSETKTDKGVLIADAELAIGVEVFVEVNCELIPAADGEYLADGLKITVEGGKVKELEDEKPEVPVVIVEQAEETIVDEVLEEPKEEPKDEPQVDERDEKIKELEKALEEKENLVKELETKIKELEDKLAEPAEDSVKMSKQKIKENSVLKYFNNK